ncbi:MAG: hypothetical protein HY644_14860 [Acidobacteria bacterium]|nr:hypothetical protein [Acidobacteriota bacterium]
MEPVILQRLPGFCMEGTLPGMGRLLYNRALYDYQISRGKLELAIGQDF